MANRFVSGTGSNTSPYDTWAKAATTLATAITGSAADDVFVIDAASPGADISANTTWTFLGNASVIASTNSGTSTITPTIMGTSAYIGAGGATSYALTFAGAFKVYFYGVTFRISGTTNVSMSFGNSDGAHYVFDNCYFWQGTTSSSGRISFGASSGGSNSYTETKNCVYRFGATAQGITASGHLDVLSGTVDVTSATPTSLFLNANNTQFVDIFGVDFSNLGSNNLVGSQSGSATTFRFSQCRFGSGYSAMATQTPANKASAKVWIFDCSSGDEHGLLGYHDAFGSIVSNTGTYLTAGAAAQSWQITTTANCGFNTPFVTPWISLYSAAATATTYKLELLRNNGTATAYSDSEVWGEFSVKDNSGFTNSDIFTDRQSLTDWAAGTAGSTSGRTGVGTGSWTISSSSSPASFIVDSGSTITQAENGHIRARVVVGQASISSLFLDPQIRT